MGDADPRARRQLNHGHHPIRPERVRRLPAAGGMGFSWVDRRLVREGRLAGLSPEAGMLYLFLVTVADRFGVSYYGEAKVADLTGLSRGLLFDPVRELIRADLVAYRHPVYQVLSLPADPEGPPVPRAPSPPSSSSTASFRPAHQDRDERRSGRSLRGEEPWLRAALVGHCRYYAVPTNIRALPSFRTQITRLWLRALRRRSQRHRMTWERMGRIAERWLPRAKILHPWPEERFDVKTSGRSPVR